MKILTVLVFALMLAGCATAPETYTRATPGEICAPPRHDEAFRHPSREGSFVWPVQGCIISAFGSKVGRVKNKGVDIRANEGSSVRASMGGKVIYCDSQLKGFGKTVILEHGNNYQSVYSYNSDILVRVGDVVAQNAVIARVGRSGRAKEASLHFEIRKNGLPQDPTYYLR